MLLLKNNSLSLCFFLLEIVVFISYSSPPCQAGQTGSTVPSTSAPQKIEKEKTSKPPKPQPKAPNPKKTVGQPDASTANRDKATQETEVVNEKNNKVSSKLIEEKVLLLRSLVSTISNNIANIDPPELSILIQTDLADVLWKYDHSRAANELASACERFKILLKQEKEAKQKNSQNLSTKRLRMAIFRKIARLDIKFVHDLATINSSNDVTTGHSLEGEWTDEAEAVMTTAMSEIKNNPTLAVDLANESLSFGLTSLPDFLNTLKNTDLQLAEQVAPKLMDKLLARSVSSMYFLNFRQFVFDPKLSNSLRQYYFEVLASRLRRDLRPNLPRQEYEDNVIALQASLRDANQFPLVKNEYAQLLSAYEKLSPGPVPEIPPAKQIEPIDNHITAGDTSQISEAAVRIEKLNDTKKQDEDYKRLAIEAAGKADENLADRLLSKIKDTQIRGAASIKVYGSFAKKAAGESDWLLAKSYALKISEPLGRSLIVDWLIKQIPKQERNKQIIKNIYRDGLVEMNIETPSQNVAKGYLILAKSILLIEKEDGVKAVDSAIFTLNSTNDYEFFSSKSISTNELNAWVPRGSSYLKVEDVLDFTEMLKNTFYEVGKIDSQQARLISSKISSISLSTISRLGLAKQTIEEIEAANKHQ